jgi:alpha-maltose-1-phosphate synthase
MIGRPKVALLTREYPPEIYGGAGVHVDYLARSLVAHVELMVHCFGKPRSLPEVKGTYEPWGELAGKEPQALALQTLSVNLAMVKALSGVELVHSHTWYANLAGHLAKLTYGIPHVMTSHSLEPLRPWKAEQLGGGYAISSFSERTAIESADAVVAVSSRMRDDVLSAYPRVEAERVVVIHNGIDTNEFCFDPKTDVLARHGIDARTPYVVFVGRITRQKGIVHLLDAARHLDKTVQIVFCAGEPDTPGIKEEVEGKLAELRTTRGGVVWIQAMLARPELIQVLSHASVFVCPSIYEPFGIVNLEAMACGVPVVASAVGGIPEIVQDGLTGYLVPFTPDGSALGAPADPEAFAKALAAKLAEVVESPDARRRMGEAGRARVEASFSWSSIAEKTAALYQMLLGRA